MAEATTQLVELDRDECLRLLAATRFGRVAFSVEGWAPVIRPVNYLFDESSQSVVFRSEAGIEAHGALLSAQAAFEIDEIDPAGETGWSVIVIGVVDEVTQPAEVRRLEQSGLRTLAPGERPHWLRIRATTVSGRRIVSST